MGVTGRQGHFLVTTLNITTKEDQTMGFRRKLVFNSAAYLALTSALAFTTSAWSQTEAEVEQSTREKTIAENEAAIAKAKAAKVESDANRFKNLGLPSTENKTTLKDGAGKIEANLMGMVALRGAAAKIAKDAGLDTDGQGYTIATQSSGLNSWQFHLLWNLIRSRHKSLVRACAKANDELGNPRCVNDTQDSVAAGFAAFKAIGGLLGTETEIAGIALDKLDDQLVALAIKSHASNSWLASASDLAPVEYRNDCDGLADGSRCASILSSYVSLDHRQANAKTDLTILKAKLGAITGTTDADSARKDKLQNLITPLEAQIVSVEALIAKITEIDDKGLSMLTRSAIVGRALGGANPKLLKVKMIHAGGSAVTLKHIGTMFGDDPLRISSGLVISWTLESLGGLKPPQNEAKEAGEAVDDEGQDSDTDTIERIAKNTLVTNANSNGNIQKSGYVVCRTAAKSFRRLQNGKWLKEFWKKEKAKDLCLSSSD